MLICQIKIYLSTRQADVSLISCWFASHTLIFVLTGCRKPISFQYCRTHQKFPSKDKFCCKKYSIATFWLIHYHQILFCSFSAATLSSWCYNRSCHFLCYSRQAVPCTLLSSSAHTLRLTKPYGPHTNNCFKQLTCWMLLSRHDVEILRNTGWMLQSYCRFFLRPNRSCYLPNAVLTVTSRIYYFACEQELTNQCRTYSS